VAHFEIELWRINIASLSDLADHLALGDLLTFAHADAVKVGVGGDKPVAVYFMSALASTNFWSINFAFARNCRIDLMSSAPAGAGGASKARDKAMPAAKLLVLVLIDFTGDHARATGKISAHTG
jgi:hypothetical protein